MELLNASGAQQSVEEKKQYRSLAGFAKQQAELDEASASRIRRRGKGLLTYLNKPKAGKLGGASV